MVLNVQHLTDWTAIKARKQQIICKNNRIENSKQIPHHYQVGDLVMLENERTLACGNGRSKEVKQVCVVGRGCSHWVMSHKVQ
jgi:hypothetical protein